MGEIISIVATDKNGVIGDSKINDMPWGRIPEDMKHFKNITKNHIVVMGGNTYRSMGSTPLSNRINVVLTSSELEPYPNLIQMESIQSLGRFILETKRCQDIYLIGGSTIYNAYDKFVDRIYLTTISGQYKGDIKFEIDKTKFKSVGFVKCITDKKTDLDLQFSTWIRK
jgi:dihydrofolate reductase